MYLTQIKNFLPKKLMDGVAPKTLVFQHQLLKLGVFKKLLKYKLSHKFPKVLMGAVVIFYLMGYQPTLAIPPFKQPIVHAQFSQGQSIQTLKLNYSFTLPHPGYLSTRYSFWHQAIDIAAGLGMPIRPIAPGQIIEVNFSFWGLGHFITIEHEQGFKSTYGHMGRIFVKNGDRVTGTTIIGEVGLTGRTTGPHTHLEVTYNDKLIDPETILPAIQNWPKI